MKMSSTNSNNEGLNLNRAVQRCEENVRYTEELTERDLRVTADLKIDMKEMKDKRTSEENSWSSFTQSCVYIAEKWIETRNLQKELIYLKEQEVKLYQQMNKFEEANSTDNAVPEEITLEEPSAEDSSNGSSVKFSSMQSPEKTIQPKFNLIPPLLRKKSINLTLRTSFKKLKKSKKGAAAKTSLKRCAEEAMAGEVEEVTSKFANAENLKDDLETSCQSISSLHDTVASVLSGSGDSNRNHQDQKCFKLELPALLSKRFNPKPKSNEVVTKDLDQEMTSTPEVCQQSDMTVISNHQAPSTLSLESSSSSLDHHEFGNYPSLDNNGENDFFNREREWNGWKLAPGGSFFEDNTWSKDFLNGYSDEDSFKAVGFFKFG